VPDIVSNKAVAAKAFDRRMDGPQKKLDICAPANNSGEHLAAKLRRSHLMADGASPSYQVCSWIGTRKLCEL